MGAEVGRGSGRARVIGWVMRRLGACQVEVGMRIDVCVCLRCSSA